MNALHVTRSKFNASLQQVKTLCTFLICFFVFDTNATELHLESGERINIVLKDDASSLLTEKDKLELLSSVKLAAAQTRKLFRTFPEDLTVEVSMVERNLDDVGGVTGIAQTPSLLKIDISKSYELGVQKALTRGLKNTLFHEFHHLVRGWTIQENKFGPGIAIAAVNEGLATVFAEEYSQVTEEWLAYPDSVSSWVNEILDLPANAPYEMWMMGTHPDGRHSIGYRAGRFIIHQAIEKSGKGIIDLSNLSPFQILNISGLIDNHAPSVEKLGDFYAKNKSPSEAVKMYKRAISLTPEGSQQLLSRYHKKIALIANPITLSASDLQGFAGRYISERLSVSIDWTGEDDNLRIKLPGKPPFKLYPDSLNSFFIYEADLKVAFISNSSDKRNTMVLNMFDRELSLKKQNNGS